MLCPVETESLNPWDKHVTPLESGEVDRHGIVSYCKKGITSDPVTVSPLPQLPAEKAPQLSTLFVVGWSQGHKP